MEKIVVDSREPNEILELVKKLNYFTEVQNLEVGDIQFGNILIERKDIGDLINSVRDNRLWEQL
jgi:ERCC4-type nuclease